MNAVMIRTGRLPYLSDSLPTIGENKNWEREKTEIIKPTKKILPPIRSTRMGRIGMTIPKPSRSINTTSRSVKSFLSNTGFQL